MKVHEALQNLQKLVDEGWGELNLIAVDTSSGVSHTVSIYSGDPASKGEYDNAGELCEYPDGKKYIGVYLD